jgi:hypothetical protein
MKNTYVHAAKVYNNRHKSDHISGPTTQHVASTNMVGLKEHHKIQGEQYHIIPHL